MVTVHRQWPGPDYSKSLQVLFMLSSNTISTISTMLFEDIFHFVFNRTDKLLKPRNTHLLEISKIPKPKIVTPTVEKFIFIFFLSQRIYDTTNKQRTGSGCTCWMYCQRVLHGRRETSLVRREGNKRTRSLARWWKGALPSRQLINNHARYDLRLSHEASLLSGRPHRCVYVRICVSLYARWRPLFSTASSSSSSNLVAKLLLLQLRLGQRLIFTQHKVDPGDANTPIHITSKLT